MTTPTEALARVGERRRDQRFNLTLLSAVSTLFGLYLVATPTITFTSARLWSSALDLVPGHSPVLLGAVFLVVGPVSFLASGPHGWPRTLGLFALALAAASWGLVAGSFLWAAAQAAGLGAGFALLATYACVQHVRAAWKRRG